MLLIRWKEGCAEGTCLVAVDAHGEDETVLGFGFGPEEEASDRHAVLAERL